MIRQIGRVAARARPSAVAARAAEGVAARIADAIAVGSDLVEEAFEQRSDCDVGLQCARPEAGDRLAVGGDVGRFPVGECRRPVVPVAVPGPSLAHAGGGRRSPTGRGRVVVERHGAAGHVARVDLLRRAPGRARGQHPRGVVERFDDGGRAHRVGHRLRRRPVPGQPRRSGGGGTSSGSLVGAFVSPLLRPSSDRNIRSDGRASGTLEISAGRERACRAEFSRSPQAGTVR